VFSQDVGTSGYVLATDISRQMLAIAKERAAFLNLQDIIEFKEGDLYMQLKQRQKKKIMRSTTLL
jgi:ubiquinone/menaquinone biosynthesis C-methylase UbiE